MKYCYKRNIKKLLSVLLIFALIGTSTGFAEVLQTSSSQQTVSTNPFSIETTNSSKVIVDSNSEKIDEESIASLEISDEEAVVKEEMGRAEKLAWTIGKALLPTLAVMGFCAAVALPLTWIVVGSIVIGAATAGITTLAYENRMNKFRDEDNQKSQDKILRDVSIAAAVEGAMAPFSMLTAGFVKAIGPATIKSVLGAAAKVGATQFIGNTVSNVAKGTVTNLWYDHYYNYDDEEEELSAELTRLGNLSNATPEEEVRFAEIMQRLDTIRKEKYTLEKFLADEKKAAVSSAITGVLGGGASKIAANSSWAKIAASKIFGSTKNAGMVANAVVSNPFAFMSGSANAALEKHEIELEISRCRKLQDDYSSDSPAWAYYEDKINGLIEASESIDLIQAGTNSMVNNLAIQSAAMTVAVAKARLWELPQAKRKAIDDKYQTNNAEWQNANKIKDRMDAYKANSPDRNDFASRSDYIKALYNYEKQCLSFQKSYTIAKLKASNAESLPENKALKDEITAEVTAEIDLNRKIDLAKSLGDEAYIEYKADEIRKKSITESSNLSEEEIQQQAQEEFKAEYKAAAEKSAQKIADFEKKLLLSDEAQNLEGTIITDQDGKKFVVLKDELGVEQYRREISQANDSWYNKFLKTDPATVETRELRLAYKIVNNGGAMVKPSVYRSTFVEMRINELKASGASSAQINSQLSSIVSEANSSMLNTFGGDWTTVVQSELISAGLSKAKYDNGEPPDFEDIYNTVHNTAQTNIIAEFQKELNKQAKAYTLDPIKNQLKTDKLGTFADKYINTVLDKTYGETIKKTSDNTIKSIYQGTETTVGSVADSVVKEVTHDYTESESDDEIAPSTEEEQELSE